MEYDNVRDSQSHGAEWGIIVEGSVVQDEVTKEFVVLDEDGKAFSSQEFLKKYVGKTVRLTCIDLVSAEKMEKMLEELKKQGGM